MITKSGMDTRQEKGGARSLAPVRGFLVGDETEQKMYTIVIL